MPRSRVIRILEIPGSELAVSVDSTTKVALWNQTTGEVLGMLWAPRILGDRDTTADQVLRCLSDGRLILGWVDVAYGPQLRAWSLSDSTFTRERGS